ncbi:MAG TPA: hypothetical protein VHF28_03240 [Nitrososphaera sp.]|nr:hypothetical protein [Nitrososphaera sp.]
MTTVNPNEPYGELRQQDPAFDNFYTMMDDCISPPLTAAEQASKPSPITCRQTIQHGMTTWCGAGENYDTEKCDAVNFLTRMYDMAPKF